MESAFSSGWPLLAVASILLVLQIRRELVLRASLNQALHEVRRPLQALALATPAGAVSGIAVPSGPASTSRANPSSGTVWLAIQAVGELDRRLNGGGRPDQKELVACRLMIDACVRRWQPRASLSGAEIRLRWAGPDALVQGDGAELASALENLIVNAIEHGGRMITVNALIVSRRLRIEVIDSGERLQPAGPERWRLPGPKLGRHGHGLAVVERAATGHGGQFDLDVNESGAKATLVLPVNHGGASRAMPVRSVW